MVQVLNASNTLLRTHEAQIQKLAETDMGIRVVAEKLGIKEKLTQKFLYIHTLTLRPEIISV